MEKETDTSAAIVQIIRDVLSKPGVGADDDVFDHGATSLAFVRILAQIRQTFGVLVHAPDLGGVATARNLAAAVAAADDTDRVQPVTTSIGA